MVSSQFEERIQVDLEVSVWGMTADGHAFSQAARTHNISGSGAMLYKIEHELKTGDTIAVRIGQKKARCKVVWSRNTQSIHKIQVGVQVLHQPDCPWSAALSQMHVQPSSTAASRRRWDRHKIAFPISLFDNETPVRVSATDISGSGCYVEMLSPFPVGTGLDAELWAGAERLRTRALVRTCDPRVGMGIEFVGLNTEEQGRFQEFLHAIDPFHSSIEHQNLRSRRVPS